MRKSVIPSSEIRIQRQRTCSGMQSFCQAIGYARAYRQPEMFARENCFRKRGNERTRTRRRPVVRSLNLERTILFHGLLCLGFGFHLCLCFWLRLHLGLGLGFALALGLRTRKCTYVMVTDRSLSIESFQWRRISTNLEHHQWLFARVCMFARWFVSSVVCLFICLFV